MTRRCSQGSWTHQISIGVNREMEDAITQN